MNKQFDDLGKQKGFLLVRVPLSPLLQTNDSITSPQCSVLSARGWRSCVLNHCTGEGGGTDRAEQSKKRAKLT